jgi:ABC-type nitrate/sulfonate/bicarbonate transport system substrate-binding protein
LEDYRNAIIVPQNSNIKTIDDLKGKVVASPFGSTSYILGTIALQKVGFDLSRDISLRNVDVLEQANIIQKGTPESWGEIAAFTSWDPTPAQFEELGKARILVLLPDTGVVVMSKKFYEQHPTEAKNFLKALVQSYNYYYENKDIADEWYLKDALVNFSKKVLETSASLERNNKAKDIKEITLVLEEADIVRIQEEADHAFSLKILKKQPTLSEITDQTFIKLAEAEIEKGNFVKTIKATQ